MSASPQTNGRTWHMPFRIVPASIATGILLAASGGFYVWREVSTPPMLQPLIIATPQAAIIPLPASSAVTPSEFFPKQTSTDTPPRPEPVPKRKKAHRIAKAVPEPANIMPETIATEIPSAVTPETTIRIQHSHENDTVAPLLVAAWQAYHNGDFDTAMQKYGEVPGGEEQNRAAPNRDALLGMAAIAQQRMQYARAAQFYNRMLELDPGDPDAQAGMFSLRGSNGTDDTETRLKLLLAQRPDAAALHFALGNFYAQQSLWGDAEQAYFNASKQEPDNPLCVFNLAVSLDHLGRTVLAAQYYRLALQLDQAVHSDLDRVQTQLRLDQLAPELLPQHER